MAPIHSLPPEILSKVFEDCWTGRESLRIGHVCRWWRSVLHDCKRFWAHAVNGGRFTPDDHSTGYLGAALQRSAPRRIKPSFSYFWNGVPECLAPHFGRVVYLEVACATNLVLSPFWNCLNSGMPFLTKLTITFSNDNFQWIVNTLIEDLSLSPAALPRLSRISAPVGLFPSLVLPSLRHITLDNPYENEFLNGRLDSECFREVFAVCASGLQTLTLIEAAPSIYKTATLLSLPALRHLQVQDTGHNCARLLLHLTLPTTTRIHCTNLNGYGLSSTVPIKSAPFRQSAVSATDRVAIISTPNATSVHCYAGDEKRLRVDICLAGTAAPGSLGGRVLGPEPDLVQLFCDPSARVTRLTVVGHTRADMQSVAWGAFPYLVAAELRGHKTRYAMKNLAHGQVVGGPGGPAVRVACPGLRVLEVDCYLVLRPADGLGRALRGGNMAVVEADLRERCARADFERVLSLRSEMGTRLTRLEFGCTEHGWSESPNRRKGTLDPLGSDWTSWRSIVEPLEKLVDGPVVFTGYRYLLVDG